MSKTLVLVIGSLLMAGCTRVGLVVANLPAKLGTIEIIRDLPFGENAEHRLDIYRPLGDDNSEANIKHPVILFFYGGRWSQGAKETYAFVGEAFAKRNYVTVIADYRKYPAVKFPAFVEDGARALAWTHDNIDRFGGDPERLYVTGHSAGAHIGALLAADPRYLSALGKPPATIAAFAGLAGPYDFIPEDEDLIDLFGPPERYPQMQVTTFVEGNEPPMLLLWGAEDTHVWRRNLDRLNQAIQSRQGEVQTKIYPGLDHVGILASLTWFLRDRRPVLDDVTQFFDQYR